MCLIIRNILVLSLLLTTSCGFKVLDKNELNNFSFNKITASGDKRVNFKIKNKLMSQSKPDNENQVLISIFSQKNRTIKEKNIKNEITKYNLDLIAEGEFKLKNDEKRFKFSIKVSGYYIVADNYSATLSNEKNLVDNLVDELSEKILNEINFTLNK